MILIIVLISVTHLKKENFQVIIDTDKDIYSIGETIYINPYLKNNTIKFVKVTEYYEKPHYPITIQIIDDNNNIIEAIPSHRFLSGISKTVLPYAKYKSDSINITLDKSGMYEIIGAVIVNNKVITGKEYITILEE